MSAARIEELEQVLRDIIAAEADLKRIAGEYGEAIKRGENARAPTGLLELLPIGTQHLYAEGELNNALCRARRVLGVTAEPCVNCGRIYFQCPACGASFEVASDQSERIFCSTACRRVGAPRESEEGQRNE